MADEGGESAGRQAEEITVGDWQLAVYSWQQAIALVTRLDLVCENG